MAVEQLNEKPIVNIVRTEIVTEEEAPKTFRFDSADEATYSPVISQGKENVLRVKNQILAIDKTEDIQYGSDINLKQVTFVPEILAIIDGGTLTKQSEKVTGYNPPVIGTAVNRTPFTLKIYTEEKDADGDTLSYLCFSFKGCKGKPASFTFKDGEFITPQYTASSRVKKGQKPYELTFMEQLPV